MRRPNPPWQENIKITPDLILRYQMNLPEVKDVLKEDLFALKEIHQPDLVNDQLDQLYLDLELEGLSARLSLGDSTSGDSSGDDSTSKQKIKKYLYLVDICNRIEGENSSS